MYGSCAPWFLKAPNLSPVWAAPPITNTSDITGREGNVIAAIASETGEFRADVVNIRGIISLKGRLAMVPARKERQKRAAKNSGRGGNSFMNKDTLLSNKVPWDANIAIMARQRSMN
jgi:hypothetical protein